ncbi:Adenine deaminase [Methanobrevibacter olleyae]|uniref:Adenine deaminase n=2 Tax=Methanobrevibacter olleyae TaxID=294671 RepID=A0A126R046_METOL|nr:adenine deaminase [Methanobrevibacter olleyae]AMK15750.1 adenine deaminase Ade [Methanobrevibacter olleyae]SFL58704.1 Adenine deaminase [Methanobrevibacter olleyae]
MDEKIINVDGNEIIISAENLDDIEIDDIIIEEVIMEDGEEPEGDLVITARYLNVEFGEVYPAEIVIEDGLFKEVIPIITDDEDSLDLDYEGILIPGFIDSHIHIESSKIAPSNFAKAVLPYGTTSVVADSHEIANVLGVEGIDFMIEDGEKVPFDFYYAVPSCVPATPFETSGAILNSLDVEELLKRDEMVALGEMMNFPGVLAEDEEVLKKLDAANLLRKPIDGHAPLVSGEDLEKYISYGISTDHESSNFDEAIEKKKAGMKIMIREGSSAKDMDTLLNMDDRLNYLIEEEMAGNIIVDNIDDALSVPPFDFLVCDDIDARDLSNGHLDNLIKKAISLKINPKEAIKMVTFNPAEHYGLNCGAIEEERIANFSLVDDLKNLNISKVWVHGELVVDNGEVLFDVEKPKTLNNFDLNEVKAKDFDVTMEMGYVNSLMDETTNVYLIEAYDGELLTGKLEETLFVRNKIVQPDLNKDIIKIAIVNRYGGGNISNGFIKGFNLKKGAIASSVAHDSHNIVVIGTNPEDMACAVNLIRENQGGLAVVSKEDGLEDILELPIAGLMSDRDVDYVASKLDDLHDLAKELGCTLNSPFMTLSFMALLVIPNFKISDLGIFDFESFGFTDLIKQYLN